MDFSYDDTADVLYLTFEEHAGPSVYIENHSGDILRMLENSAKIIGVTIPFFLKRAALRPIVIPEIGTVEHDQVQF